MQVIITQRDSAGRAYKAQSQDGRYTWFAGQDGYINDTLANQAIYQMAYLKKQGVGSDPLPAEVRADVRAFLDALWADEQAAEAAESRRAIEQIQAEPTATPAEVAARRAKEQAFDELNNEGGEGFNPYRAP